MMKNRRQFLTTTAVWAGAIPVVFTEDDGWIDIGEDLKSWDGAPHLWRLENDVIIGETSVLRPLEHHSYLIWRGGALADFELRLEFRAPGKHNNSGVQYRSRDLGDHQVAGYQCNIHPRVPGSTAVLEEMKNGRGGHLADIGQQVELGNNDRRTSIGRTGDPKIINASLKKHGWNMLTIRAEGNRLRHWLNDHLAIDAIDKDSQKAAASGLLALQLHSGHPMRIEFRSIRLKRLTAGQTNTEVSR